MTLRTAPQQFLEALFFGAWVAAIIGAGPAAAETMDELYSKAKAEGQLTFYAGGPAAPFEAFAGQFEARYPGITVAITGGFSNVLNGKINEQLAEHKLAVDMAFFQTVQDFVAWKQRGVLANFKPEGYDQIAPAFRDPDGAFTTIKVSAITYAYNSTLVAPDAVPKSALDFLKPEFKGKLITCYPADDDATLYLFHTIAQKYGWDYMDRYMANQPNFVQGHLNVARSVGAGGNAVTFDGTSTADEVARGGQPIKSVFSEEDLTPLFTLTAGIFNDAPHPNAAKLFLSWYMAPEQQSRLGVFSPRLDVPPPPGLKPLSSYKVANDYKEFVTDDKQLNELRQRFEKYTGPVVNKGGVR
jgi:ABC-type Fe3+ transport system substrate-binding protein